MKSLIIVSLLFAGIFGAQFVQSSEVTNENRAVQLQGIDQKTQVAEQSTNSKLDVNEATAEQLVAVKGIGPSKAAAIIQYRREIGGFKTIDELIEVKGIGQKALAKLKLVLKV